MTRTRCPWAADHMYAEVDRHSHGAPPVVTVPRRKQEERPTTKQADSRPCWQRYTGGLTPKARGDDE